MSLLLSSAAEDAAAAPRVNKRELADILGTSLPTISAYLVRYAEFPVLQSGTNGREWIFDPVAVKAFLAAREAEEEAEEARRHEALGQLGLAIEEPRGELASVSAKDRLAEVQSMLKEDELRIKRGFLVSVPGERQILTAAIARWSRAVHAATRQAARDFNLPDAVSRALLERVAETQRQFTRELQLEYEAEDADRPTH